MKKVLSSLLLLAVILVISGCDSSSDRSLIRQNNEQSIIRELIEARLTNINFEEMQEIHTKYRTQMEFTVWDNYFDVSNVGMHSLVAITESYNLVPKSYTIKYTAFDEKDGVNTYIYVADLKAVPTGAKLSSTEGERHFTVYFAFKFDSEGILYEFYTSNRLESAGESE